MADTKTQPIIPPIADVNHNGLLDGEDIRAALAKESTVVRTFERNSSQRAHGVMETLQMRSAELDIVQHALKGEVMEADGYEALGQAFSGAITTSVKGTTAILAKNPKAEEQGFATIEALGKKNKETPSEIAVDIADRHSYLDFAKTFAATFPKGVKIDGKDMPAILDHFRPMIIQVPDTPSQPRTKNNTRTPI